ncbi:copper ion binding protein [Paenibacillus glycanilyticus]|uniref:Copper chaperone CopZ n=1 Tax=Paenibacillus glycanilyticus TaxID=126569 RepID=A0ABQ6GGX4_9BACL|nr:copper ion binding protein [Paenibacillus glycanilyticus]GLX68856.1 copper chaperone CopZ [Paenibacillus glycanilyticus]
MTNVTLKVEGMSCGHCVSAVEKAVTGAGANGSVDLAAGKVTVSYDEKKVSLDTIKQAIEEQGYDIA